MKGKLIKFLGLAVSILSLTCCGSVTVETVLSSETKMVETVEATDETTEATDETTENDYWVQNNDYNDICERYETKLEKKLEVNVPYDYDNASPKYCNVTDNSIQYEEVNLEPIKNRIDCNQWYAQYPSGSSSGGMLLSQLNTSYKNKYLSGSDDYLKFSLNAQDEGKSSGGSNVRSELHSKGDYYYFSGKDQVNNITHETMSTEFEYTFKVNCSQPGMARFTVGQCNSNNSPILMISYMYGELIAYIKYYNWSYVDGTTSPSPKRITYSLGSVETMEDINIRISLNDRSFKIYRDQKLRVDDKFPEEQDTMYGVYFKFGLYYQTKATDTNIEYLHTDVYVKDVKLEIK